MPRTYDKDKYGRERTGQYINVKKQTERGTANDGERKSITKKEKSDEKDKELARANEVLA